MTKLPISVCLFTSTRGHYQASTCNDTLNLLARLIPLDLFGALYAHIKVTPGEEALGIKMELDLTTRGFGVDATVGGWQRGASHQQAYLIDMRKASQSRVLLSQPYMLLLEDDSPFICHGDDTVGCLIRMVRMLEQDPNLVSTRFIRRGDYDGGVPHLHDEADHFYSPHFDFQPAILRSRDYFLANKVLEAYWGQVSAMQCEMAMRMALDNLTRDPSRAHLVWKPDYAETYHLGIPNHAEELARITPFFS